ncbi:MAG: RecQ family ATP-dependent DNA helicase [Acutalibacteraceae bacterium]|nr:RecQ family ATP-dependent DNA helicase [Clostridia bacterium]MEE3449239.1 RecQ family ATP-dependent DNA helicase [Acutalibacteraceae bacterium]
MNNKEIMLKLLKKHFGYDSFKKGQEKIINTLLSKKDVLCVMPTGGGKSVCFQIPALMLDGITVVVSPLISLMNDQTKSLNSKGISAVSISGKQEYAALKTVFKDAAENKYKILYISPEKLENDNYTSYLLSLDISMIVIDEAHCVSQWGQSFRPSYLKIRSFISKLSKRPVISAFTATASVVVRKDIINLLGLTNTYTYIAGFDRPNIYYSIISPKNKNTELLSIIKNRFALCGIVYCSTRFMTDKVYDFLEINNIPVVKYHAGMTDKERTQAQNAFLSGEKTVMTATVAFGMGIDKPDISYIVHYNMPLSFENYYQETGRAGRDGEKAECIMMYNDKDLETNQKIISNCENIKDKSIQKKLVKSSLKKLDKVYRFCHTKKCLRNEMLAFFGEYHISKCGKCSSCKIRYQQKNITLSAQKILSSVARTEQRAPLSENIYVLKGIKTPYIVYNKFDTLSTFAIMQDLKVSQIRILINALINLGYLRIRQNKHRIILQLTENAVPVLKGEKEVFAEFL